MKLFHNPFARKAHTERHGYFMDRICKPDEAILSIPSFMHHSISFDPECSFPVSIDISSIIDDAILKHEAGNLTEAFCLFVSASKTTIGLFLCALSVRHGWGCTVDMHLATKCLENACTESKLRRQGQENIVGMGDVELSMILFELGQCYRYGWGVSKGKEDAAMYYKIAADLGDIDAQIETADCYLNGIGVKKNKYMAACYYRLAASQGHVQFGASWIYKSKYEKFFKEQCNILSDADQQQATRRKSDLYLGKRASIANKTPVSYLRDIKLMIGD